MYCQYQYQYFFGIEYLGLKKLYTNPNPNPQL